MVNLEICARDFQKMRTKSNTMIKALIYTGKSKKIGKIWFKYEIFKYVDLNIRPFIARHSDNIVTVLYQSLVVDIRILYRLYIFF